MKSYQISLQLPVRSVKGEMRAEIRGGEVMGIVDLMGYAETFHGTIDGDGNCGISGKIRALFRTIAYHATGKITTEQVLLTVCCEYGKFLLEGIAGDEMCER